MFQFIIIVLFLYVLYQHFFIKTHIRYKIDYSKVLMMSPITILELYKLGKSIPYISKQLYMVSKIDFGRKIKKSMCRQAVESIIIQYMSDYNSKGVSYR